MARNIFNKGKSAPTMPQMVLGENRNPVNRGGLKFGNELAGKTYVTNNAIGGNGKSQTTLGGSR